MRSLLSVFALLFLSLGASAQVNISSVGGCTSYTLTASTTGTVPTDIGLYSDDSYSALLNIGFNFNFYGTPYTQFTIGQNGSVCFDATLAGGYNPWSITSALLGNANAYNSICGAWCDINGLVAPQPIYYSLQGTAPNRTAAITWCHLYMFNCTTEWITSQIILYESTNVAEVHIGHKTFCTAWNGGYAIVGVQNATGSAATTAPGRDYPSTWNATNEAWRFTPIMPGSASYAVTSIPYSPLAYSSSIIYWYDSTTGAYLGSGPTLVVTPTTPTTYKAGAVGCQDTAWAYIHLLPTSMLPGGGGIPHISALTSTNPTVCGLCNGTVTLHGITPHQTDSVFYSVGGVPHAVIVDSAGADSTITLTGLCAGAYDYFYIKVGMCPSNVFPATLVNPPITASFIPSLHVGCNGDSIMLTNTSTPAGYTSTWTFGDGGTSGATNPMHVYADQATYTGSYPVVLSYTTYPGCVATYSFTATFNHPVISSFTTDADMICLGTPMHFTNASTPLGTGATYLWSFGDGGTDTNIDPTYTYPLGGVYTATLTVRDSVNCVASSSKTLDIISIDVHTAIHDTSVCLADSLLLTTQVYVPIGTIDSITYEWTMADLSPAINLGDAHSPSPKFMGIGDFTYVLTATTHPLNCNASDMTTIHSFPPVTIANLTRSPQTIAFGSSIQLNADSAKFYTWTPDNGTLSNNNISNPVATPTDSVTTYTVYGMSQYGCLDSAKVVVYVDYGMDEYVPSAFSPNGDGKNDIFHITNLKYQKLVDFRVYNRWGQVLFQSNTPDKGWDGTYNGTAQDLGVYNYEFIVASPDGTQKIYKGTVTLIR